jgi:RNA polymerase sigma-70 factor, ECF subfamily
VADAGIIAAARQDDRDALRLVERHGERAYRLAVRITGVSAEAVEAVEDALLTAAATRRVFADEAELRSWIDRTVARAAYQRCTRRPHVVEAALDDVVPPLAAHGHFESMDDWSDRLEEPAQQDGLRAILTEAIDTLPADHRTALIMHDIEGMTHVDVAEILDVDVAGVKARVHRARLFVRKRLSEYFAGRG